jgi:hypothetical protein
MLWQRSGLLSDISRFAKDAAVETPKTEDLRFLWTGSKRVARQRVAEESSIDDQRLSRTV